MLLERGAQEKRTEEQAKNDSRVAFHNCAYSKPEGCGPGKSVELYRQSVGDGESESLRKLIAGALSIQAAYRGTGVRTVRAHFPLCRYMSCFRRAFIGAAESYALGCAWVAQLIYSG